MLNKNIQVNTPLSEKKEMWSYSGKNGKSWYRLKLLITQSKTLFELEYYNHKKKERLINYFEDKNDALEICELLEQLNGR